jgi:hypothetical protein
MQRKREQMARNTGSVERSGEETRKTHTQTTRRGVERK